MPIYAGVSSTNRQVKTVPVGVSGANRNCKSVWAGVSGVNRQVFAAGEPISTLSVGDIVKIKENGTAVEFIILDTDYPIEGRIIVIRKNIYNLRQWNSASGASYLTSDIHNWLNSTYLNLIESGVRSKITEVPIETSQNVNTNLKVFLLSNNEADLDSASNATILGTSLSYFLSGSLPSDRRELRIAYYNGKATRWWTRNRNTSNSGRAFCVPDDGDADPASGDVTLNYGARPAFTLPSTILVDEENNVLG